MCNLSTNLIFLSGLKKFILPDLSSLNFEDNSSLENLVEISDKPKFTDKSIASSTGKAKGYFG
jgi:hypothetical protein